MGRPVSQDFRFQNASVYFFAFPELGRIKIGVSNDVESRLRRLATEQKCMGVILHTMPGNRRIEAAQHKRFSLWRVEGEWFRDCPEARNLISKIATRAGAHE